MSESNQHYESSYRRQKAPAKERARALQNFDQRRARPAAWFGWRPALAGGLVLALVTSLVLRPAESPVESAVSLMDETHQAATLARLELPENSNWSDIQRVAVGSPVADMSRLAGATRSLSAIHNRVDLDIPRLNHISLSELKPEES